MYGFHSCHNILIEAEREGGEHSIQLYEFSLLIRQKKKKERAKEVNLREKALLPKENTF